MADAAQHWTLQRLEGAALCQECVIDTIQGTALGILAVGRESDPGADSPHRGIVYRVGLDGTITDLSNGLGLAMPVAAVSTAERTVVVGYRGLASGLLLPGVVVAAEGGIWEQSTFPLPDDATNGEVRDVVAVGESLLVVGGWYGAGGVEQPAVWSSQNGLDWQVAPLPEFAVGGRIVSAAVREGRVVLLAVTGYGPDQFSEETFYPGQETFYPGQTQNGIFVND